jgi:hypothetical protein
MLRRTPRSQSYWARYRFNQAALPKAEGPAPLSAPQSMNATKKVATIDPINDPFPRSIRGNQVRPDVPERHFVDQWFVLNTAVADELTPWSAEAPAGAYRFRPYDEFDSVGREQVTQLRRSDAARRPDGSFAELGRGWDAQPTREVLLTKMDTERARRAPKTASACTVMERALKERVQRVPHLSPLQQPMDIGRTHAPLAVAGNVAVDKSAFPFSWRTEDWYEYEVARTRMQRFAYENEAGVGPFASEVTYKIVLSTAWEHHADPLVDDVLSFLRDVGRGIVEEKLRSVRATLDSIDTAPVDPDVRRAFNLGADEGAAYSDEEINALQRRALEELEAQCVSVLALCNASASGHTDVADRNASWPFVEKLDPWVRMIEYWGQRGDSTFTDAERSTRKYEFRRFFRVIKVKMPFQSSEFEKRMYDVRHWLHRHATVEFQTIMRKNLVHDGSLFPVEADEVQRPTHEQHGMYSFALDWHSAPANYFASTEAQKDETWAVIATRVGCTEVALREANPQLASASAKGAALPLGTTVFIPGSATKRLLPATTAPRLALSAVKASPVTWEAAAAALGCSVEELQAANGTAAVGYTKEKGFAAAIKELLVPMSLAPPTAAHSFSDVELTHASDTFESVARRLGTTVEALRAANPGVESPGAVSQMAVPATASRPRRRTHPLARSRDQARELFPTLEAEVAAAGLPQTLPREPANAAQFPGEYQDGTGQYPITPNPHAGQDSWLAYTATHLDRRLSASAEARPLFHVNRVWPAMAAPGTLQQQPFEEDQTWLLHRIPTQVHELQHPELENQGLPNVNHEQFPVSLDWRAP